MGNAQSAGEGHRVSKPRTNREAAARSTKSLSPGSGTATAHQDSPSPNSSSNAASYFEQNASANGSPPLSDDNTLDEDIRQQIRAQLLAPDGRPKTDSQVDLLAPHVARSLSRTGARPTQTLSARSSTAQLQNGSQALIAGQLGRNVDLETAVTLLNQLRKTASPGDLDALHKALMPMASRDTLSTAEEREEDLGTHAAALIRRKSFAQPGVATRLALPKTDPAVKRKSAPVPAPSSRPQVWNREMLGASPLTRLTSLEGPSKGREGANTPADLEYSQLGNMKHGSLMIINGPPSPIPSVASPGGTRRRLSDDEDFFTASERGDESDASPPRPLRQRLDGERAGRSRTPDLWNPKTTNRARSGSPLKREVQPQNENLLVAGNRQSIAHTLRETRSMLSMTSHYPESRLSYYDPTEVESSPVPQEASCPNQSAEDLANGYMDDLPSSPFATRHVVQHDETFYTPVEERNEGLYPPTSDIRETVLDRPLPLALGVGQISPRKPLNSNPTLEQLPPEAMLVKPLRVQDDSGYSSNAASTVAESLSPTDMRQPNLPNVELLPIKPAKHRSQPQESRMTFRRSSTWHPQRDTPDATAGADETIIESIEQDPPEMKMQRSKSWRKSWRKSLPRLLSTESTEPNNTSNVTLETTESKPDKPKRKLQKRRPLSQPPIDIADRHNIGKGVPRVPSTVFSKYSNRLSASPGMQYLAETHENAVDLRRGSASPAPASATPPVPAKYFPDAGEQEDTPPAPPKHNRLHLARRSLRRSKTLEEGDVVVLSDFGDTAQSLGTSPYDIAMSGPRGKQKPGAATHPHQLGADAIRSKPQEGWDAETASRIARERSRQRAAMMDPGIDVRCPPLPGQEKPAGRNQTQSRPQSQNRPMSYHENAYNTAPRPRERSLPRPKTMHENSSSQPVFNQAPRRSYHESQSAEPETRPKSMHDSVLSQPQSGQLRRRSYHESQSAEPSVRPRSFHEHANAQPPVNQMQRNARREAQAVEATAPRRKSVHESADLRALPSQMKRRSFHESQQAAAPQLRPKSSQERLDKRPSMTQMNRRSYYGDECRPVEMPAAPVESPAQSRPSPQPVPQPAPQPQVQAKRQQPPQPVQKPQPQLQSWSQTQTQTQTHMQPYTQPRTHTVTQTQTQLRPQTAGPSSGRDPSPVKKLVSAFEQRASEVPAPPPMPSPQPDWSDSSRTWRQRRMDAQTSVKTHTTSSKTSSGLTTTTTTVTAFAPRATVTQTQTVTQRPSINSLQGRKSMPQLRSGSRPRTMESGSNISAEESTLATGTGRFYASAAANAAASRGSTPGSARSGKQFYGMDFGDMRYSPRVI